MITTNVTLGTADFEMNATVRSHKLLLDEPAEEGGQDKGPTPMEMLCAALASCTVATVKMYLNHKKWTTGGITAQVTHHKTEDGKNVFTRRLEVQGTFDAEQKSRILAIANKCPVHKTLEGCNSIETQLV